MDWQECVGKRIVKDVCEDESKIHSIKNIAKSKIMSADYLPKNHSIAKISLLYDALREYLEARALQEGYKIYNHECYTAFIKEILKESEKGDLFDSVRKMRNSINYYGKHVSGEQAEHIIVQIKELISFFE